MVASREGGSVSEGLTPRSSRGPRPRVPPRMDGFPFPSALVPRRRLFISNHSERKIRRATRETEDREKGREGDRRTLGERGRARQKGGGEGRFTAHLGSYRLDNPSDSAPVAEVSTNENENPARKGVGEGREENGSGRGGGFNDVVIEINHPPVESVCVEGYRPTFRRRGAPSGLRWGWGRSG